MAFIQYVTSITMRGGFSTCSKLRSTAAWRYSADR
jgi:hypothetical protein